MADEKPSITDAQRAEILRRVRSGYDLEAAAVDCGVDAVAAMRDPDLMRDFPAAYAVGSSRIRARTLEAAIAKGDASALIRFNDKREVATQAALEQINGEASTLGSWLASHGLEPPEGRSATEWFVDLFTRARTLAEQEKRLAESPPSTMAVQRAHEILEAAGYTVVCYEPVPEKPLLPEVSENVIDVAEPALPKPQRRIVAPIHRDPNHSLVEAVRTGRATTIGRS